MAYSTLAEYLADAASPAQQLVWAGEFGSAIGVRWIDGWSAQIPAPVAPTTAVVPTQSTGLYTHIDGGAGRVVPVGGSAWQPPSTTTNTFIGYGGVLWCDRLSHQGGLSGNVGTVQTTNLPTAALTRYTDGVGVMCMVTLYGQIGTSSVDVTVTYTDQGGNTGQVSPLRPIGGTSRREASTAILIPLAAGDTGVRAVADLDLSATTGTAGNMGITLFRPLFFMPLTGSKYRTLPVSYMGGGISNFEEVLDGACLFPIFTHGVSAALSPVRTLLQLDLAEC